jgi:hypothetical protein
MKVFNESTACCTLQKIKFLSGILLLFLDYFSYFKQLFLISRNILRKKICFKDKNLKVRNTTGQEYSREFFSYFKNNIFPN